MKKIEAKTLDAAYAKAAEAFDCSVTDLEYEIIQYPRNGFLGFGTKNAVIVASCRTRRSPDKVPQKSRQKSVQHASEKTPLDTVSPEQKSPETPASQSADFPEDIPSDKPTQTHTASPTPPTSETAILNGFFDAPSGQSTPEVPQKDTPSAHPKNKPAPAYDAKKLGPVIEEKLSALMRAACFGIDTVEVDVVDGTAYIFIDGEDAALLIGKEGYRYNAISYLLYNWLHNEYGLFIKLEIAQFLASQQEMIRNYIQPVIEHIHQEGWGKTRPLDGILVHIALEQLREEFPHKYVAIKRTRNGERYVLVNAFNKRA